MEVKLINNAKHELLLGEAHALRLLNMPNNGGWKLAKDSGYTYNKDGLKRNKAEAAGKKEKLDDK